MNTRAYFAEARFHSGEFGAIITERPAIETVEEPAGCLYWRVSDSTLSSIRYSQWTRGRLPSLRHSSIKSKLTKT